MAAIASDNKQRVGSKYLLLTIRCDIRHYQKAILFTITVQFQPTTATYQPHHFEEKSSAIPRLKVGMAVAQVYWSCIRWRRELQVARVLEVVQGAAARDNLLPGSLAQNPGAQGGTRNL
jgi:hypothetical protein